ncbi:MAG: hypothetical protein E7402_00510 [Ruminococcaceae bacterium]|nr:hypothetical protein [Oscillospiraceae bacterium]
MKMLRLVPLFLLFLLLGSWWTVSAEGDPTQAILQDVLSEARDLSVPGFDFRDTTEKVLSGKLSFSFESVLKSLAELIFQELQGHIGLLVKLIVLSVLAGVLCTLQQGEGAEGVSGISFLACFASVAGIAVSLVTELCDTAVGAIDKMVLFVAALMPAMASLSVTGMVSADFYPGLFVAMQGFVAICKNFLLPMIMITTALSVVGALGGRFHITRLIEVMSLVVKWILGLSLTVFVGILGIHSTANTAAVGIAGRTMKYALCNFVPLVGSVLAESAETVLASVRAIRGAVGLVGCLGLVFLCCLPLVKILTCSLLFRFASGAAEPATDKRIVQLLSELSANVTLIFSILLMVTVMFIISLALLGRLTI